MTNDGSANDAVWSMPKFSFEVDFGDGLARASFQEVSGLDVESQIIEYRHGNSPLFSPIRMPGMTKYGNVTMNRGIFVSDNEFWDLQTQVTMNTIKRRTIVIKLLDESGKAAMTWTLENAWPTKITATDMKSDGNEIAVDTIEIAHEKMTISNG